MALSGFTLNHRAIAAFLNSSEVGSKLADMARAKAPSGTVVDQQAGKTRQHVRITDPRSGSAYRPSARAQLLRALGQ